MSNKGTSERSSSESSAESSEGSEYRPQSVANGKRGHRPASHSPKRSVTPSSSEAEALELVEEETLEDVKRNLEIIMDKYTLGSKKCPPDVAAHADGVAETVIQLSATCGLSSGDWQSKNLRKLGMVKVRCNSYSPNPC
jgi:hypothetical protein